MECRAKSPSGPERGMVSGALRAACAHAEEPGARHFDARCRRHRCVARTRREDRVVACCRDPTSEDQAETGVDRRCGWFRGQRRPCVTITRAVVAIRRCRRLLTAAGADSARRTAEGPCMAHGPWRPGSQVAGGSRSLVADPPFFCGLTPDKSRIS